MAPQSWGCLLYQLFSFQNGAFPVSVDVVVSAHAGAPLSRVLRLGPQPGPERQRRGGEPVQGHADTGAALPGLHEGRRVLPGGAPEVHPQAGLVLL